VDEGAGHPLLWGMSYGVAWPSAVLDGAGAFRPGALGALTTAATLHGTPGCGPRALQLPARLNDEL